MATSATISWIGNALGGVFGSATSNGAFWTPQNPHWTSNGTTTWVSATTASWTWPLGHTHPQPEAYASLADYVKALLRVQDGCTCKWCKAEPLERAMATVVARKADAKEDE